jgi:ATP-dependent helicase/nuclease subunit A
MATHHNLLIEAGAGTGKTTRLVRAVLEALFIREIPLDHLVALTFTNKAAGELKERVSLALDEVLDAPDLDTLKRKPWWFSADFSPSLDHLKGLAQNATGVLDRTDIATIHSFAYSLLKRFPIAAGINPDSVIDDKGLRFDELFREAWPEWLKVELGADAPREAAWLDLLNRLTLGDVEDAARRLSDFEAPVDYLPLIDADLPQRLEPLHTKARALAAEHSGTLVADRLVQACEEVLGAASKGAWEKLDALDDDTRAILEKAQGSPKTWSIEDLETLGTLHVVSKNLMTRGDRVITLLTEMLKPFVIQFRDRLLSEGILSHSALLFLSRELVRLRPDIREQLKKEILLILIDEFQDTDPLQAELLLFLAETPGHTAERWEDIQLEPGKLFIVGDPKQSIYRFRGADIAAYQQIGERVIRQGGQRETLDTNYRSQAQIIDVVNTAFDKLMSAVPDISPPYVAVKPRHPHDPTAWPIQGVELWLATSPAKPQSVEDAQGTEAEAVAAWIENHVGSNDIPVPIHPTTPEGKRSLAYRDVALIFRSYSPMDRFIEALRRRNIPFAVESERFFFSTPEVTDFLNLLRTIADPTDELSKVGFLKGPLAAIPDADILQRKTEGTLDTVEPMEWIRSLHARLKQEPLGNILQSVFDDSFLLELAARSYHGDQTVANLLKLRRLLESLAAQGDRTMTDLLERLDEFFDDDKLEGESPLADESYDAVRILTIHKAKGLEFPVVFLPSLHCEIKAHKAAPFVFDWRKQKLGLAAGSGFANLDKLLLDREARSRDAAEQQRILYVAMTRAKQRLILSGGIDLSSKRSATFLNQLAGAWGFSPPESLEGKIVIGPAHLTLKRLAPVHIDRSKPQTLIDRTLPPFDPVGFATIWKKRAEKNRQTMAQPLVLTPSTMKSESDTDLRPAPRPAEGPLVDASSVGTLVHRVLERWDFQCKKCDMPAILRQTANIYFSGQGLTESVEMIDAAQRLLASFIGSADYAEVAGAEILGREIPFFYGTPLVRGTIDILYKKADGTLIIGDYKTGLQAEGDHSAQGTAYQEALQRAIGLAAQFKVIPINPAASRESVSPSVHR